MNKYRLRVDSMIDAMLNMVPQPSTVLDFGSGDGLFASRMQTRCPDAYVAAVDVKYRSEVYFPPILVDSEAPLPFKNNSFDLVYAIDVLHHCNNPLFALKEIMRVSSKYILIKDHVSFSRIDSFMLAVLDELGNKRFGIPSPYLYQKNWEWEGVFEEGNWLRIGRVHPAICHGGVMGWLTNHMQYVSIYEKS